MPSTWALRSPVILSAEAVSVCSCNSFGAPLSVLSISYVTLLNASVAALEILELPACTCTLSLLLTLPLVSEPLLTTGHSASQVSPHSGHYSRQVTAHGRFLLTAGYCSLQVPAHGRSLLTASHCSQHVTAPRRPLPSAGHCSRHVTAHRGPLPSAGHCSQQVTVPVMPQLAAGHCSPQAARHHAPLLAAVRCLPPLLQPTRHSPWQYTSTYWCFVQTLLVMHAPRQVPTGGHSSLPKCSQARCCHHCSLRVSIQTTVSSKRLVNVNVM